MYKPKYRPQLENALSSIPNMTYGLTRPREFVEPNASDIESLHLHGHLEIFFNIDSDVSFLVNGRLYPVARGDLLVSRPRDVHMCIYNSSGVHDYFCLWIDSDLSAPLFSFLHTDSFCPLFRLAPKDAERLVEHLEKLSAPSHHIGELTELLCILDVLATLHRMVEENRREEAHALPSSLQAVVDDIHCNFSEIRSVTELARAHYVSSSTLSRWFGEHLHISPREYLESRKLAYALTLLRNGKSVTDACTDSGFSDCSYFIARFKRKFGETPMQYKRKRK